MPLMSNLYCLLSPSTSPTDSTTTNPEESELRAKSSIEPHEGTNKTPLATTKFPESTVGKQPVEPKGAFAALRARGIRITNYKEEGHIS
jgi:hypothetical protein